MNAYIKRAVKALENKAQAQFLRFLELKFRTYADLCVFGPEGGTYGATPAIARACREWLPSLTDPVHRDICQALAEFHEASSARVTALSQLMRALRRYAARSNADNARFLRDIERVVRETGYLCPPRKPAELSLKARCDYCGSTDGVPTTYFSGEPVSVCDRTDCTARHDAELKAERKELADAGYISAAYH